MVYQENVDLSISASRLGRSRLAEVRRVDGVADVGQVSFTNTTLTFPAGGEPLDVSLIGVEPGQPGEPPAFEGRTLNRSRGNEAIIDRNVAFRAGVKLDDTIIVKSIQGVNEELYPLTVVGISDVRQFFLQPSIFVPNLTWDKIRPKGGTEAASGELISNVIAVKLDTHPLPRP